MSKRSAKRSRRGAARGVTSAPAPRARPRVARVALAVVAVVAVAVVGARLGRRAWERSREAPPVEAARRATEPARPAAPPADGLAGPTSASYVGRERCAECHPEEVRRFEGSHHDRAMQVADEHTVLGDFRDATFTYGGVTSRFSRRNGKLFVSTDGPDGRQGEYEIAYTFGVEPLQQYLVAMPGGRLQALSIAWDSRPAAVGGQRWFHLYPNERVGHDDVLHWTRPSQNWNDRCARCHSTNLRRRYRADGDRYDTTWSELDVSCEACHGPASVHVERALAKAPAEEVRRAFAVDLHEREPAAWIFDGASPIARRSPPRTSHVEVETCAPCHARRAEIADGVTPGRPLLDDYVPALLDEGLYFADGQIQDEVYEYGSFVQSRMYRAGVTCSDCHDPHGLRLRAEGNALCARCHLPARFDTPEHHDHPPGSPGAQCVACHMPTRTYMVVHERRDHAFRVPRPDLSAALGAPDVCTSCHHDRSPQWAAETIARRPGPHRLGTPHYGQAIQAGRQGAADAEPALLAVVRDAAQPPIVRATALGLLRSYPSPGALAAIGAAAADPDPLVRLAALQATDAYGPDTTVELGAPRLTDPVRAVRFAAVQALAGAAEPQLGSAAAAALARGLDDYRAAALENADRPESHLNLAAVATRLGQMQDAERAMETAVRIAPFFVPAAVNFADLRRVQGRDDDGERLLRAALAGAPESAEAHHALGLLLARRDRLADALGELARAVELAPDNGRYAYVLGVALHSAGATARALDVLRAAHARRPGDRDLLVALATISRDAGDRDGARVYAAALVALAPWDQNAQRLRAELQ